MWIGFTIVAAVVVLIAYAGRSQGPRRRFRGSDGDGSGLWAAGSDGGSGGHHGGHSGCGGGHSGCGGGSGCGRGGCGGGSS